MLTDKSVRALLDAFASPDPTPGGGSAAALAAAAGAALLVMVAGLPRTRSNSDEDRTALGRAAAALGSLRERLTDAVDEDTAAYDRVVAAYRLPKSTDAEQAARKRAIQSAMRGAIEVPLDVMRSAAAAMGHASAVAIHGHKAAASDAGVAIELLRAAFNGARLNVEVNVGSLTDVAYVERVHAEMEQLAADLTASATAAGASL